jgi:DNA polymerase III delta prime subunit
MYVAPIDIAGANEQLITAIQKTMATGNSLAERVAMVLMNVDRLAPDLLDKLLKTVEEPGRDVALVMTATQLRDVRVAVRSRSRTIKLRRLSAEESALFVGARIGSSPPTAIDAVLATLDADARGLPHLLERACRKMLADGRKLGLGAAAPPMH